MLLARATPALSGSSTTSGSTAGASSCTSISSQEDSARYAFRSRPRTLAQVTPTKPRTRATYDDNPGSATPYDTPAQFRAATTPRAGKMSTQTGKFREDQVLIICPGSQTTMAQLGCGELTPPVHRMPTRMFKDEETGEWRPFHTFKRKKAGANGALAIDGPRTEEDDYEWVEDTDSSEGAIYPLQGGRIANMEAFLAFLDHVHSMLTTTYHNTPIMLIASPQWTRPDNETIARYIFEKTRTPALCMMHSGIASQYGVKWPNVTVVDIGYEKVDVSCIHDGRVVGYGELGAPNPERFISGGEIFTRKLVEKLKSKDFTYDMAEQLKKSHVCEVLPYAPNKANLMELPTTSTAGAAASATAAAPAAEAPQTSEPARPVAAGDEEPEEPKGDEGVLDVASIVTTGNARDFLAKKEKEKQEKGKGGRKGKAAQEAEAAKPVRLPNSKRTHNMFHFEEVIQEEVQPPKKEEPKPEAKEEPKKEEAGNPTESKDVEMTDSAKPAEAPAPDGESKPAEATPAESAAPAAPAAATETNGTTAQPAAVPTETPAATNGVSAPPERQAKRVRRDIEVGLERFTFADRGEIDRIVTTIYRTVQSIDDMYIRPLCWDNIIFVGNGARLRGLKDNIMQTLMARHLISPSTATMFTSELPSNIATPTGTGAQTPTGSFTGAPHQLPPNSSGVNPLLQAATTASAQHQGTPGPGEANGTPGGAHHFHSQTPTSIKLAALPTYLGEWNKNGFEEAMFLGAQVAARIAFCQHNLDMAGLEAQRLASLSRIEYNEMGPKGIRTHSMLK